jgi:NADH-quinone oxidoreductase subunit M
MLIALVVLYMQSGSSDYDAFRLLKLDATTQMVLFWGLFIAFAIKMPIFPFHTWQPDTYTESPTPATMLLSGIMLKMGVYSLFRWLLPITPLAVRDAQMWVIILAVVGIVYGAIIAIQQKDIKRLIAYSSFSHVGLMAAGVFCMSEFGLQGTMIQMLAHGINVVGLFYVIDIIQNRTNTREIENLGGITQSAPALTIYFTILMLGSVALPLTNGFVGEFLLLRAVFAKDVYLGAIAGLTIIFGAVYMLRMYQRVMFGEKTAYTQNVQDVTVGESLVLFPLTVMVFVMGLFPNLFLNLSAPAVMDLLKILG